MTLETVELSTVWRGNSTFETQSWKGVVLEKRLTILILLLCYKKEREPHLAVGQWPFILSLVLFLIKR